MPALSGGDLEEATPDPIPNSEVKLFGADGTAREAVWESRTPPGLFPDPDTDAAAMREVIGVFFILFFEAHLIPRGPMTEEATANAKVLLLGAGGALEFLENISGDGVFDAHGSRVGRWTFAVRGHSLGLGFALPSDSDSAVRWAAREARLAVVIPGADAFEWIRAALLQPEVAALPKLFLFPNDIPRDVCMQELGILDKDSEEFLENVCWDVRSLLNQLGKRVFGASREELKPKPWPFPSV